MLFEIRRNARIDRRRTAVYESPEDFAKKRYLDTYLYQISSPNGPSKIGISSNAIKRFLDLQLMCPTEIFMCALWLFETRQIASMAEYDAHSYFRGLHSHGEWFFVTKDDLGQFVSKFYPTAKSVNLNTLNLKRPRVNPWKEADKPPRLPGISDDVPMYANGTKKTPAYGARQPPSRSL